MQYPHRVGAKEYQSDRIFWGGNEGRKRHMASHIVETYPKGSRVPIRFDPQNPAEAVIDPVQNTGSRPLVIYAMAMIVLGLFVLTVAVYTLLH